MVNLVVSSFYKYVNLNNVESFRKEHQEFCNKLNIKGKVLVSAEGINGSVSGTKEQIEQYEKELLNINDFSGIKFKRSLSDFHPFRKTIVRTRPEIVSSGFGIDASNVGKHLTPLELKNLYDNNADFIILDARNDYESKIGRFKNAIIPNIETFREFPQILPQLEQFKDKKIVMYCTGGVRCEKASALLLKHGFKDVNQLQDGIFNYIEKFPGTYFEGRCFVFDDRLSIPTGEDVKDLALCEKCHIPCGEYTNCMNPSCNKLIIFCKDCREEWNNTCSKSCRNIAK